MHLFMDIPFNKTTPEDMIGILSEKGINPKQHDKCTLEAESVLYFEEPCHLIVSFSSSVPSFSLTVDKNHTGINFPGTLSKGYTHRYMIEMYEKMKVEFGEPDYAYRGIWRENNSNGGMSLSGKEVDCNGNLDPYFEDEFIEVVFGNVALYHGYFYNQTDTDCKDLTSIVIVTYYPEKKEMPEGVMKSE